VGLCILYLTGAFSGVSCGFEKLCEEMIDIHANTESGALLTTKDAQAIADYSSFHCQVLTNAEIEVAEPVLGRDFHPRTATNDFGKS